MMFSETLGLHYLYKWTLGRPIWICCFLVFVETHRAWIIWLLSSLKGVGKLETVLDLNYLVLFQNRIPWWTMLQPPSIILFSGVYCYIYLLLYFTNSIIYMDFLCARQKAEVELQVSYLQCKLDPKPQSQSFFPTNCALAQATLWFFCGYGMAIDMFKNHVVGSWVRSFFLVFENI